MVDLAGLPSPPVGFTCGETEGEGSLSVVFLLVSGL